ncbi:MAG: hypothetical protein ABIS07_03375 [Dokdonella sp.]
MPEMQEHFPAMATDRRYAGNAGAFSGDVHVSTVRWTAGFLTPEDTPHIVVGRDAGAIASVHVR